MRIIPRREWGACYSAGFGPAPLPARGVYLHHSVTKAPPVTATLAQDIAAVRQLEAIGQSRFGGGISYTFAICPSGRIFEGHGINRQGAHTKGMNDAYRAIVLVGNYDTAKPTTQQVSAVQWLLAEGARMRWWTRATLTGGHQQAPGAQTACPGRYGMAAIPAMNRPYAPGGLYMDADVKQAFDRIIGDLEIKAKKNTDDEIAGLRAHVDEQFAAVLAAIEALDQPTGGTP